MQALSNPIIAKIRISHGDRVVYPDLGITKLVVVKYYEAIGKWIVRHVAGRPLTLVHCPNGIAGRCAFMKHSKAWGPERSDPDLFTTKFAKAGRESKILLDYLRNNQTKTSIAAYSTRARPGATVSVPVSWYELEPSLDPKKFTIQTVPRRLKRLRADPWKDYWSARQELTTSMIKAVGETLGVAG